MIALVYQFLTSYPLFTIAGYDKGEEDEADDDQFSSILGPLSRELLYYLNGLDPISISILMASRAMELRPKKEKEAKL